MSKLTDVTSTAMTMATFGGNGNYLVGMKKGSTQKEYKNKDSNIIYITDDKGNVIKRKRIKKC